MQHASHNNPYAAHAVLSNDTMPNDTMPSYAVPDYGDILAIVGDDFRQMDRQVFGQLNSKVQLIMKVSEHVMGAGGKRMRPLMALLVSRMLSDEPNRQAMELAAITEMLHTATLVHDDVIDESMMRRGRPTANATWNNATAVLVGDYLIARSFNLLVGFGDMALLKLFSDGTCDIAEGEVLQLQHQHSIDTTESDYLQIIDGKTSQLFVMAVVGAALLHRQHHNDELLNALRVFGYHFGNAFQMIDDVLDFMGDSKVMGKHLGDDLAQGKPTLPIIKALQLLKAQNHADYDKLRLSVQTGKTDDIGALITLVQQSGALAYCRQRALDEASLAQQALQKLPNNKYRTGLEQLTHLAVARLG